MEHSGVSLVLQRLFLNMLVSGIVLTSVVVFSTVFGLTPHALTTNSFDLSQSLTTIELFHGWS